MSAKISIWIDPLEQDGIARLVLAMPDHHQVSEKFWFDEDEQMEGGRPACRCNNGWRIPLSQWRQMSERQLAFAWRLNVIFPDLKELLLDGETLELTSSSALSKEDGRQLAEAVRSFFQTSLPHSVLMM